MEVVINGKPRQAAATLSLAQAVALLTDAETGVAAAVNGDVIRRAAWAATPLSDGDEVEVLTAVQGG
ncbi:MAG TPA: sulfur carrier protein ThiS [Streptosporangiaceae bacterium]|nr:sulfur carrier protein ThiS [Streptosporangiaceae bacterium]